MNALRQSLEAELSTLERRRIKIEGHLRNADGLPADWAERATATENDEVLELLDDRTIARISALRYALEHMDQPDWGVCQSCGKTIPPKRLEILPTTTVCVRCAEAAEH